MSAAIPLPKPRFRPRGEYDFDVDFGTGTARIFRSAADRNEWCYEVGDQAETPRYGKTWGIQEALAQAWARCIEAPPTIELERTEIARLIHEAEYDVRACAKLMRRFLRLRTGIAWSVTGGRGTARSWIRIHSPKARRVNSDGIVTGEDHGYMGAPDRALLGAILGTVPHFQGESIRTEKGVRSWYLWRISGHPAPDDLVVHPPSWD